MINSPPAVSVVTPSYNQATYLESTILSVLQQDYPGVEYIVIDGGSTDGSVDIIRKYAPRLAYWVSGPDAGQAAAINTGFARAQGQILAWINSDDTYLPGAIRLQAEALQQNPQVGLVYGDAEFVDADGHPLGPYHARAFNRRRFLHVSSIPQPTAFFRRSLYVKSGGLDTRMHYALDYEFFLRLMWQAPFMYTRRAVATYRIHSGSKTVRMHHHMIEEALQVVEANCARHPTELRGIRRPAMSDWNWLGAMQAVNAGDWVRTRRFALAAFKAMPFRPRMAMFALSLVDWSLSTNLTESATSWLDQRANNSGQSRESPTD